MEKTIEEKLIIYKKELESVINQLTSKRSELGEMARKTAEDLEVSIPGLRSTINDLQNQIKDLNKEISIRNEEYSSKRIDLDVHYANLEKLLKDEYISRKKELDNTEILFLRREELNLETENNLSIREKNIAAREEALLLDKNNYEINLSKSEELHNKNIQELELRNHNILQQNKVLDGRSEEISKSNNTLNVRKEILDKKDIECAAILKRIDEANLILEEAKKNQEEFRIKEESINQAQVKSIADVNRLTKRSDLLDAREIELSKREENIKISEAAIAKG